MQYKNLQQLQHEWQSGDFQYPENIKIAGIPYHFRSSSTHKTDDIVKGKSRAFIVYATSNEHKQQATDAGLQQWIVFVWYSPDGITIAPQDLASVSPQRFVNIDTNNDSKIHEGQRDVVGDVVLVKIQLPSTVGVLKGKVDTGADISSLHAEQIKWDPNNSKVQFVNSQISPNRIIVPIKDRQAVKSADGGTEYRPVIELDIQINDKVLKNVLFNLNDRGSMDYPVLIGQNVLEKAKLLVDPSMDNPTKEDWIEDDKNFLIDWEQLTQSFSDDSSSIQLNEQQDQQLQQLLDNINDSDITLKQLVEFITQRALTNTQDIEY